MKPYKLFTDSTSDLTQEFVDMLDITVVPTEFTLDGQTYLDYADARDMSRESFWQLLRAKKMPKTAVINPDRFYQYFEPALKDGFDILHIVFSTGLAGTRQNALLAAEELKEKYPDQEIRVVDSLSASHGEGLLVYYAAQKKNAGASLDEVAASVEQMRGQVCVWFTVDDLQHLKRGGRVTATTAAVGGVLNIKPIMHIDAEGKLVAVDKVRGRKTALETLLTKFQETAIDPTGQIVFLVHADCLDDANWMAQELRTRFGVPEVFVNYIGPVIGTHAGPGALGVCFRGSEK